MPLAFFLALLLRFVDKPCMNLRETSRWTAHWTATTEQ
jgi:hypothetical protein